MTSRGELIDPQLKLKQLSDVGSGVAVDNSVPVIRYLRSGPQMERMARTYYAEGQWEQAFILYNKFATLFVEKLPKHPGYSKAPSTDRQRVKKLLKPAFERAMELKEKLKKKFEEEKRIQLEQIEAEEKAEAERKRNEEAKRVAAAEAATAMNVTPVTPSSHEPHPQTTPPLAPKDVHVNSNFGQQRSDSHAPKSIQLQNETEFQEKPEVQTPTIKVQDSGEGDPEESWTQCDDALLLSNIQTCFYDDYEEGEEGDEGEEQNKGQIPPLSDSDTSKLTATNTNLSKVLPDAPTPQRTDQPSTLGLGKPDLPPHHSSIPLQQPPPYVPPSQSPSYFPPPQAAGYAPPPPSYSPHPPAFSPQPVYQMAPVPHPSFQPGGYGHDPYLRSSSYPTIQPPAPHMLPPTTPPASTSVQTHPHIDRSTKPVDNFANSNPQVLTSLGGLEGGSRPIVLPSDISSRFLSVASSNTRKNIETCGVLCGKLDHNKLKVTHIVIPKQTGKADSCETLNEEEIFGVQDKYDLITLGWIHTHPSQTSFMSSVDLHTHCSYQLMLEEAIAVVCAPKYSQVGVFTLTQPHGLNFISKCSGKGFHTHPKEPPIYEESKHIEYDKTLTIRIVDLR